MSVVQLLQLLQRLTKEYPDATLRDLRRAIALLARFTCDWSPETRAKRFVRASEMILSLNQPLGWTHSCLIYRSRACDRLISRYGARARLVDVARALLEHQEENSPPRPDVARALLEHQEENSPPRPPWREPKSTDEIRPSGLESSSLYHGGTGNSGECDHVALSAPERPSPENCGSDSTGSQGPESIPEDAAYREDAGQPTGAGETDGEEPAEGTGTPTQAGLPIVDRNGTVGGTTQLMGDRETGNCDMVEAEASCSRDTLGSDQALFSVEASQRGDAGTPSNVYLSSLGIGFGRPSPTTDHYGGDYSPGIVKPTRAERRAAQELQYLLLRIFRDICGSYYPTPRISPQRLICELAARRVSLTRARRQHSIRNLIIAVDVSASCAHTVRATLPAALAVAQVLPRGTVCVLQHSNGFAIRQVPNLPAPTWLRPLLLRANYYALTQHEASQSFWTALARRPDCCVLALGDADAHWALQLLRCPVIMLAHAGYSASYPVLAPVVDIFTAVKALRQYLRKGETWQGTC